MAKTLPPKLGGSPPVPTGGQAARTTQPSLPAVGTKSGAVQSQPPPQDPKAQPKKKLKDVDWSQKGYFDGEGFKKAGEVEKPQDSAPKRGRTLVIPAVQEQPQPQPQAQAEGKGAWAEAESPSTHDAKEARETQKGREADAKATAEKRSLGGSPMAARKTEKLAMQPPPLPGADKPKGTLYELLENAKEPGTLYTEDDEGGGGDDEQEEEDPELMEAVEECIQRLFGVRGIHHIGPGTNDAGEKVIVIATAQGFGEESMRRVPSEVRGFKTLVALPFDLLPLKRTGPR